MIAALRINFPCATKELREFEHETCWIRSAGMSAILITFAVSLALIHVSVGFGLPVNDSGELTSYF